MVYRYKRQFLTNSPVCWPVWSLAFWTTVIGILHLLQCQRTLQSERPLGNGLYSEHRIEMCPTFSGTFLGDIEIQSLSNPICHQLVFFISLAFEKSSEIGQGHYSPRNRGQVYQYLGLVLRGSEAQGSQPWEPQMRGLLVPLLPGV